MLLKWLPLHLCSVSQMKKMLDICGINKIFYKSPQKKSSWWEVWTSSGQRHWSASSDALIRKCDVQGISYLLTKCGGAPSCWHKFSPSSCSVLSFYGKLSHIQVNVYHPSVFGTMRCATPHINFQEVLHMLVNFVWLFLPLNAAVVTAWPFTRMVASSVNITHHKSSHFHQLYSASFCEWCMHKKMCTCMIKRTLWVSEHVTGNPIFEFLFTYMLLLLEPRDIIFSNVVCVLSVSTPPPL
jgi:hypothetical protein